jgi:hypothetical protein
MAMWRSSRWGVGADSLVEVLDVVGAVPGGVFDGAYALLRTRIDPRVRLAGLGVALRGGAD